MQPSLAQQEPLGSGVQGPPFTPWSSANGVPASSQEATLLPAPPAIGLPAHLYQAPSVLWSPLYQWGDSFFHHAVHEILDLLIIYGFPGVSVSKESACNAGDPSSIPGSGRSLERRMATHSRILAWSIPWTEEPGGRQCMGSQSQTRLNN